MFKRQFLHYLLLGTLLLGVAEVVSRNEKLTSGQFVGIPTGTWLMVALAIPILHQFYVWFVWRSELYHTRISKWFGKEKGFRYYTIGFLLFFIGRPISITLVSLSNRGTLALNPVVVFILAAALLIPWVYLEYSVRKYFAWDRAMGKDHFDISYRALPFVRQGMFKYTRNGMYTFGFLILWIIGLAFFSQAALLAALFNHLYIWVHYYCTELPDIHTIYGKRE